QRSSANAKASSQTVQHTLNELHRQAFAMQERAMGVQKIAVTRTTVQLAPWATIWMAVGAEVAKSQPASIVTAFMRAKVHRGVDGARASVGRGHRIGSPGRRCCGMMRVMCTRGAMRALRETLKRFGLVGPLAFK